MSVRLPACERLELAGRRERVGPGIRLEGLAVAYGATRALEAIDLVVEPGELLALIGPSGSGKSSLLRCLAGFLLPTSGRASIGDEVVSTAAGSLPPERRRVGYVFQSHALWPHMTARDNVAYPWKVRGLSALARRRAADALLDRVGLGGLGGRRPAALSGGQRQRVALARALAGEPRILLLDEPFSSVDVVVRDELLALVRELVEDSGLTTVFTTHDEHEATALADRTAVLVDGHLAQVGTPRQVYEQPVSSFVARFTGASNVVEVAVTARLGAATRVRLDRRASRTRSSGNDPSPVELVVDAAAPAADTAVLVLRPEDIGLESAPGTVVRAGSAAPRRLEGAVVRVHERGASSEVHVQAGGIEWKAAVRGAVVWRPGERVVVRFGRCLLLPS